MGSKPSKINGAILKPALRQAKSRLSIRRGQKLNLIAKKKREIKLHIEAGNEEMALIHVIFIFLKKY